MLTREQLKDLLSKKEYSRTDKLLICLAVDADIPKAVAAVRNLAEASGLRAVKTWNVSQFLGAARGLAIRTTDGWELTSDGKARVQALVGPASNSPVAQVIPQLRAHLPKIGNAQTAAFVEEAIKCLESGLLRAGVVLGWVGAMAVLYDHVVAHHLATFNAAAKNQNSKWKSAATVDDLARMKEADFLTVLESASIIGRSVKQELEGCLKLRNGAGHPNQLRIGNSRAAAHVESLMLNVFSVFV